MPGRTVGVHKANSWKYDLVTRQYIWLVASYGQNRRMFPCLLPEYTYSNTSKELTTFPRTNLVLISMCILPPILAHNCPVHKTTPFMVVRSHAVTYSSIPRRRLGYTAD